MNQYQVEITRAAARNLNKLPSDIQKRIFPELENLKTNPRPHGAKKLSGSVDRWRVRVGDYRIIYQIKDSILYVLIIQVAHRREAYKTK